VNAASGFRFAFEARPANDLPDEITADTSVPVEVYDCRALPRGRYLGTLNMTGWQRAALAGEMVGAAAVRALHCPCHADGDPEELCAHADQHRAGPSVPVCRECGKPYPCPTREVLPS
jgi:hypothetical protein